MCSKSTQAMRGAPPRTDESPSLKRGADQAAAAHGGPADALRSWMHQGLYDLPHEAAILALGCEQAFLTPHLAEYSRDVTVLDSSADQVAQLARRFPEIAFMPHAPANALPFAHDTFGAIWCCEWLDRILDPAAALREMRRVLTPAGRLLLVVPDAGPVKNVLRAIFPWDAARAPANPRVVHFTRAALAKLAREAGFGDISTLTVGRARDVRGGRSRHLLLRARKGPGPELSNASDRARTEPLATEFAEELAYANRTRAA